MSKKSIAALSLVLCVLLSLFSACGTNTASSASAASPASSQASSSKAAESAAPAPAEAPDEPSTGYPIITDGSITMRYWVTINNAASKFIETYNDNPAYQQIEENTGIKMEFIHPAIGQEQEQFNLMVVSGEYPDLVANSNLYKGGEFQGMYDGVFMNIVEYLPEHAPDYWQLIVEDEEFFREVSDVNGDMCAVYAYKAYGDPPFHRVLLRTDVLDEIGVEIPETLADYEAMFEKMLTAGITPFMPNHNKNGYEPQLLGMYGIMADTGNAPFFKDGNGKIYYGQVLPEFKEYLTMMSDWYNKGYISKDFTNVDSNQINTLFDTKQIGMTFGAIVANFNRGATQGFEVTSAPYPRINKGDQLHYEDTNIWPKQGNGAMQVSISNTCKYPVEAVRWLNYGYTEEGAEIYNWGVQGVNWDYNAASEREYNDLMLNNEQFGTEEASYIYKIHFGPKLTEMDTICHANLLKSPDSLASRMKWSDDPNIDSECRLPPYQLTTEEQELRTKTLSNINTYADEMVLKFITGAESLDNFDAFVDTIKGMGIDELLASEQGAYERYMQKKLN